MSVVDNPPPQWRAAVEIATIAAALGMRPAIAAVVVDVDPQHLQAWREGRTDGWDDDAARRVEALKELRDLLFIAEPWTRWEPWWHLRWHEESPLAGLSPMQAVVANRERAMRVITDYLWGRVTPGFS